MGNQMGINQGIQNKLQSGGFSGKGGILGFLKNQKADDISNLQTNIEGQEETQRTELEKLRIKMARSRGTGLLSNVNTPTNLLG